MQRNLHNCQNWNQHQNWICLKASNLEVADIKTTNILCMGVGMCAFQWRFPIDTYWPFLLCWLKSSRRISRLRRQSRLWVSNVWLFLERNILSLMNAKYVLKWGPNALLFILTKSRFSQFSFQINHRYYVSQTFISGQKVWRNIEGNPDKIVHSDLSKGLFKKKVRKIRFNPLSSKTANINFPLTIAKHY